MQQVFSGVGNALWAGYQRLVDGGEGNGPLQVLSETYSSMPVVPESVKSIGNLFVVCVVKLTESSEVPNQEPDSSLGEAIFDVVANMADEGYFTRLWNPLRGTGYASLDASPQEDYTDLSLL